MSLIYCTIKTVMPNAEPCGTPQGVKVLSEICGPACGVFVSDLANRMKTICLLFRKNHNV